jgi:hypothetical protein
MSFAPSGSTKLKTSNPRDSPQAYQFADNKRPSSEARVKLGHDEQQEVSHVAYKHLWLRERHGVDYDLKWHLWYLSTSVIFFGGIATYMCGRVRSNNLAKFSTAYKSTAVVFGLVYGNYLHDNWQRTRWYYHNDDDI